MDTKALVLPWCWGDDDDDPTSLPKVIVCGGRHYRNRKLLNNVLDHAYFGLLPPVMSLIEGFALITGGNETVTGEMTIGADRLAQDWAQARGHWCRMFRANWAEFGKAAGPIRNKAMLDWARPEAVIAFPGGAGTNNMKTIARKAGVPVVDEFRLPQ